MEILRFDFTSILISFLAPFLEYIGIWRWNQERCRNITRSKFHRSLVRVASDFLSFFGKICIIRRIYFILFSLYLFNVGNENTQLKVYRKK